MHKFNCWKIQMLSYYTVKYLICLDSKKSVMAFNKDLFDLKTTSIRCTIDNKI